MADGIQHHEISLWFSNGPPPCDWYRAFEAYGHAMSTTSAFEQLMGLLIMKAEVLRLGKRMGSNTSNADQRRIADTLLRSTYNNLMRRLCQSFQLSEELRQGIADGKGARDYLAHNFWQAHMSNLWSERGIEIIASDCALYANHFRLCSNLLFSETGVDADEYLELSRHNAGLEERYEGWERLLTD